MSKDISITRALTELKTLDGRITKAINKPFIHCKVGGRVAGTSKTEQEVNDEAKQDFQSYHDLMERRNKIKCAIVKSNATTMVEVGDKVMTVAEAIERKTSVRMEEEMLNQLKSQYKRMQSNVEQHNAQINNKLSEMIQVNLSKDRKVSEDDYKMIAKPFLEQNEASLVDPLKLNVIINSMEKDIEDFKLNVDFALSEVNALTKVQI